MYIILLKDNSVRLWKMLENHEFRCVAIGMGHTHAVATVAWARYVQPDSDWI